jgi:hypothetical protein
MKEFFLDYLFPYLAIFLGLLFIAWNIYQGYTRICIEKANLQAVLSAEPGAKALRCAKETKYSDSTTYICTYEVGKTLKVVRVYNLDQNISRVRGEP